jgi:hypothetical protein
MDPIAQAKAGTAHTYTFDLRKGYKALLDAYEKSAREGAEQAVADGHLAPGSVEDAVRRAVDYQRMAPEDLPAIVAKARAARLAELEVAASTMVAPADETAEQCTAREEREARTMADAVDAAGDHAAELARVAEEDAFFENYPGTFTVRRANIRDQVRIENEIAVLTEEIPIDRIRVRAGNLATMCATLSVVVVKGPEWWPDHPAELFDTLPLSFAHAAWRAWADSFRR